MPGILDYLGYAGNLLDLPGSSVRDLLTGNNPFDQWATPFSDKNRASGRDVLRPLLGENEETGMSGWLTNPMEGLKDIAGFGVEVLADPLNFVSGGAVLRALRGGKAARAHNSLINATRNNPMRARFAEEMAGQFGESGTRAVDLLDSFVVQNKMNPEDVYSRLSAGPVQAADDATTLYQNPVEPYRAEPFYSKIMDVVDSGKIPNRVGREQLLKTLVGQGVKQEEITDMTRDLDEMFAAAPDGKVLKDDLFALAADKAWGQNTVTELTQWREPIQKQIDELNERMRAQDRDFGVALSKGDTETQARLLAESDDLAVQRWAFYQKMDEMEGTPETIYHEFKVPGGNSGTYKEILLRNPMARGFNDPHFSSVGDVMAHIRADEVNLPDGTKAFRIQEIQSDLHQKGRDAGYTSAADEQELDSLLDEYDRVLSEAELSGSLASPVVRDIEARIGRLKDKMAGKVPDAPFKKSWPELAAKAAIRNAVENGYDTITLVPGEVIARAVSGPPEALGKFYNDKMTNILSKLVKKAGGSVEQVPTNVKFTQIPSRYPGSYTLKPDGLPSFDGQINKATEFVVNETGDGRVMADVWNARAYDPVEKVNAFASFRNEADAVRWVREHAERKLQTKGRTIFRLSPQHMEEVMQKGQPLYQMGQGGPRGQIAFNGGNMRISALDNPIASTAPHEATHAVRRLLSGNTLDEATNMFGGQWDVPAEEMFATGAEDWLRGMQTTSPAMQDTMGYFNREIGALPQNPMRAPNGAEQLYSRMFGISPERSALDAVTSPSAAGPVAAMVLQNLLARQNGAGGDL